MTKNRMEIDYLKQNWMADPCWDIETTTGFEDYKDELLNFRLEKEAEWKRLASKRLWLRSYKMGTGENLILAQYLIKLEDKIDELESRLISKGIL